jgi:hypothetical protein
MKPAAPVTMMVMSGECGVRVRDGGT